MVKPDPKSLVLLQALREAAEVGFAAIARGDYFHITDENEEQFYADLAAEASAAVQQERRDRQDAGTQDCAKRPQAIGSEDDRTPMEDTGTAPESRSPDGHPR